MMAAACRLTTAAGKEGIISALRTNVLYYYPDSMGALTEVRRVNAVTSAIKMLKEFCYEMS